MKPPSDIPESFTTERLVIRRPEIADVPAIVTAVRESLAELQPWMRWATSDYSAEACEQNIREAIAAFVTRDNLRYHSHDRESGEFIGSSGLHRINWSVPRFEIGYWVRTPKVGQGYAAETVRGLTRFAFDRLGARRIEIRCDDLNSQSARVAERCGYELDAILRNWQRAADGSLRHERVYVMLDPALLVGPTEETTAR